MSLFCVFQGKHTGNMKKHLRRHHPNRFKEFEKEEATYKEKKEALKKIKTGKVAKKNAVSQLMSPHEMKIHLVTLQANGRVLALNDDKAFQAFTSSIQSTWTNKDR